MNASSEIQIGNFAAIAWLISALVVLIAFAIAATMRRQARRRFATNDRIAEVFASVGSTSHRWLRGSLLLISIVLLSLGLMDWRWGKTQREVPQKGIEIMFLLDVSRSMLAQDVTPSRLERAKQMIRDMVGAMAGDRVGLVAFAGETRRIIPLTNHYEDFTTSLADVGPDSLRRGGSRLGEAIQAGGDGFLSKTNSHRVMIVLTDGEDQESEPAEMAKRLHADQGIRIFTVGLGDVASGAKIPDEETQRYVRYQGEPVVTKLNGEILQAVAEASQGAYIPAGTKQVDMKAVYERYIAGFEKTDFDTVKIDTYEARFQWFALPALVLLLIEGWMIGGRRKLRRSVIAAMLAMVVLGPSSELAAQSIIDDRSHYNQGVEAYQSGDLETAIELFDQTSRSVDERVAASARYNAGTSRVAQASEAMETGKTEGVQAELQLAISSLRSALRLRPRWEDARANLEKAVRMLDQLSSDEPQQNPGDAGEQNTPQKEQDESKQDPEEQDPEEQGTEEQGTENEQQSSDQQDPQPSDDASGESSPNESENQSTSEPKDGQSDSTDQSRQPKPADESDPTDTQGTNEPQNTDGQLASDAPPTQGEDTEQQPTTPPSQTMSMTEEEAKKMLQAVRDRDMIRRFRQQQANRTRQVPVEKDW